MSIRYHHDNNQRYQDELVSTAEENEIFADRSVDTGDISDDLTDESIREKIKDDYLRDFTAAIVLVGTETRCHTHVDWEIYSGMHDGAVNKKSGIVVIMLPQTGGYGIHAPHGNKKDLYPGFEWTSFNSRVEYERQYPQMPDRLIDNLFKPESKVPVVPWTRVGENADLLKALIDMAYGNRVGL